MSAPEGPDTLADVSGMGEPEAEPEAPAAEGTEGTEAPASQAAEPPDSVSELRSQVAAQANMLATLQGTISQLLGAAGAAVSGDEGNEGGEGTPLEARQQALWSDPDAYMQEHAVKPAVEEVRKQIVPFLEMQARDKRAELTEEVRGKFDGQYGAGAFDETVAADFNKAIDRIPIALQASRNHVMAAAAGVLGHYYLTDKGDTLDKKRAARREAPRLLDQSRPRPRGDTLTPDEKVFVASVQRNDPSYNEARYLKAKARIAGRRGAMG